MRIKFEKEVNYCKQYPFCYYERGSPNYYVCEVLAKEISYEAIIKNPYDEIHEKCPFLKNNA